MISFDLYQNHFKINVYGYVPVMIDMTISARGDWLLTKSDHSAGILNSVIKRKQKDKKQKHDYRSRIL